MSPSQSPGPGVNKLAGKPSLKKPKKSMNELDKAQPSPRSARSKDLSQAESVSVLEEMTEARPHPIEKINHFIEVGFLIDNNNFRFLKNFEEATFDSNL